jgi:hypothetical protein
MIAGGEEQNGPGYWRRHGGCEEKSERRLGHCQGRGVDEREGYEVRGRTRRREALQ